MIPFKTDGFRVAYPYAPVPSPSAVNLLAYTGEPVRLEGLAPVPPNSVLGPIPPIALGGKVTYYDAPRNAWVIAKDIRTVDLAQHKAILLAQLDKTFNGQAASLSATYTEAERYTWQFQEADALAYQKTKQLTPLLQMLASANDYPVDVLCERILIKATVYRKAYAQILAEYQAEQNRIRRVPDVSQLRKLTLADLV